jgi:hypothetical protein
LEDGMTTQSPGIDQRSYGIVIFLLLACILMIVPTKAVTQGVLPLGEQHSVVQGAIDQGEHDPFKIESGFGPSAESTGGTLLDSLLNLLAGTVLPFLALLAVQGMTVFFVLRFMMRPSKAGAEEAPTADSEERTPRAPGAGPLNFLGAGTANGIVLTGPSYERYRHTLRAANKVLWGFFGSLVGFLLVSVGVVAVFQLMLAPAPIPLMVAGVQAVIAVVLFVVGVARCRTTGNPLSTGYAVFSALLLLVPAVVAVSFGALLSLAIWPLLPLLLWSMLRRRGRRAGKLGKQDLLVLRVFGADANAASLFGALARSWRHLGPSITIADPSYIRYEFSATNKGNRWRMIITSLAFGVGAVVYASPMSRAFLAAGLGLSELTPSQLTQVAEMAAIVLLLPLAALPVFISVWRNFTKSRESLLQKIKTAMGAKMRWNGVYECRPYYCHDDLWRTAVRQMMKEAEVVLMDFRGFNPSNRGCEYEIGKVLDTVPIHRVVLLLDENTDHDGIFQIFRDRWADMAADSPNGSDVNPTLKVFTAHPFVSWRDGIWPWLKSLPRRQRRWKEDGERILAFIATAPEKQGAAAIP